MAIVERLAAVLCVLSIPASLLELYLCDASTSGVVPGAFALNVVIATAVLFLGGGGGSGGTGGAGGAHIARMPPGTSARECRS